MLSVSVVEVGLGQPLGKGETSMKRFQGGREIVLCEQALAYIFVENREVPLPSLVRRFAFRQALSNGQTIPEGVQSLWKVALRLQNLTDLQIRSRNIVLPHCHLGLSVGEVLEYRKGPAVERLDLGHWHPVAQQVSKPTQQSARRDENAVPVPVLGH